MTSILLIPKSPTRWRGNLKGLLNERGWLKPTDNLGASPFKKDLSNDTTFSQTNLAGQSLYTIPNVSKFYWFLIDCVPYVPKSFRVSHVRFLMARRFYNTGFGTLSLFKAKNSLFNPAKNNLRSFCQFWRWKASSESILPLQMVVTRLSTGAKSQNW